MNDTYNQTNHPGIFERIRDYLLAVKRSHFQKKLDEVKRLLVENLNSHEMDRVIEVLLHCMRLLFILDPEFRKNIRGFNARYAFVSRDKKVGASAIFQTGRFLKIPRMHIRSNPESKTNITVTFQDAKSMAEFLLTPRADVFSGILDNRLALNGNINYILKFAYMARHIPVRLGITLPEWK